MVVSSRSDGVDHRDEKGEQHGQAEGEAEHHKNSADATGERAEETPPIQMRVKMKHAHGTAELCPPMFPFQQNWAANQDENKSEACTQKQQTGLAVFSEKFQHGRDAA